MESIFNMNLITQLKDVPKMVKAIVFDFGGVLAEEGFKEGLKAIGKKNELDPDVFLVLPANLFTKQVMSQARRTSPNSGMLSGKRPGLPEMTKSFGQKFYEDSF
jgi:hypothetical protein